MRKILTSFAIVTSLVLATAAAAQGTGSSGTGQGSVSSTTSQGNGASGGTGVVAPVGHRQPRASEVPDEKNDTTVVDPRDAALDRALRSICRGC